MSFSKFSEATALPELGKAFLDCGAFSVLTGKWKVLPIDDYIEFVAHNHMFFEHIAAPDVIGSVFGTYANLVYFIGKLRRRELWDVIAPKVVITYHLGDHNLVGLRNLLEMSWSNGISWLAVGGIVAPGTSLQQRYSGISEVLRITKNEVKLPFKIHLFGGYNSELIRAFLPASVDSSTYMQKARMLQSFRYLPGTWEMKTRKAPRHSDVELLDFVMDEMENLYTIIGDVDKEELRDQLRRLPDGVKFWVVNGLYMRLFEREVQQQQPEFKYWMTVASLDDGIRYGEFVSNFLFTKMWKGASLVAYPSFYGMDELSVQRKLQLLR